MLATAVSFTTLLLAALTAGGMFGIWLGMDPRGLAAAAYVAQQQRSIRAMNVAMPVLGAVTTLATVVDAYDVRGEPARCALLLASAACFLIAGAVTRWLNQPINALVMTWPVQAPPPGWERLRDAWWRWHVLRTASAVAGLCLSIAATVRT